MTRGPARRRKPTIPEGEARSGGRVMFHCHCFPPNPARFPMHEESGHYPGTIDHLCAFARRLGFEYAAAISPAEVPAGRATARIDRRRDGHAYLAADAAGHDNVLLFANMNPAAADACRRLEKAVKMGFVGVKLHPVICRFSIDAQRDRAFYGLVEKYRMPLLLHTGIMPGYPTPPISDYHPQRAAEVAARFPGIPMIFAHGGGRAFCREVLGVMQANPNTYLDLTHTLDRKYAWHIPDDDLTAFFEQIGASRMIYGTDYPFFGPEDFERDMACLRRLGLDDDSFERLLGGTVWAMLNASGQRQRN